MELRASEKTRVTGDVDSSCAVTPSPCWRISMPPLQMTTKELSFERHEPQPLELRPPASKISAPCLELPAIYPTWRWHSDQARSAHSTVRKR
jgi:hypothetical protein